MRTPFPKGKEKSLSILLGRQLAINARVAWMPILYNLLISPRATSYPLLWDQHALMKSDQEGHLSKCGEMVHHVSVAMSLNATV